MGDIKQFEGADVIDYQAKLPAVTVDCDDYPRGTIIRVATDYRVKGVRYEENAEGQVVRVHVLAVEDIAVVANFHPSQNRSTVGGSASGTPEQTDEGAEELGLDIGRSSDQWPPESEVKKDAEDIKPDVEETAEAGAGEDEEPEEPEEPAAISWSDEDDALVAAATEVDPGF